MQAEKYLFYLSKSGTDGEKQIMAKHAQALPPGLAIRIINPKAIILAGRDHNLNDEQRLDFEFVRRSQSGVMDVISCDDFLRRLDNVIANLRARVADSDPQA